MKIKEAAEIVMGNVDTRGKPAQFPPFILAIIIQVIANLITKYGPTLLDKLVHHKPLNLCDRFIVRTIVKQCCPSKSDYKEHGKVIVDAVLESAEKFTPAQVRSMMDEVKESRG